MKKNIKNLIRHIQSAVSKIYETHEADAMAMLVAEHLLQLSRLQLRMENTREVDARTWQEAERIITRLLAHEPLQYVLGTAHFYGLELTVNPAVLIPRPETEELVDLIVRENKDRENLQVLDICTGSGCIAIALSVHLRPAKIFGLDISEPALAVARINALKYSQEIEWLQQDVLSQTIALPPRSLDIIVSNPPYVLEQEKSVMRQNVLAYEPHLALFVPDTDALRFYKRIGMMAAELLKPDGRLYFEINEGQGAATKQFLEEQGFKMVKVVEDLFGRDRFVKAGFQAN